MFSDPNSVTRISSLGAGPIGGGWTAHFLARGYDVTAYLHDKNETNSFMAILKTAWVSLEELGLAPGASMDRLCIVTDLEEALKGTDFVQESGPERLEVKQELYSEMGRILPPSIIIGSSTSGLMMSDIQSDCSTPERTVIGHPFNPPYLLPLVEIVGGKRTAPEAVAWAGEFYRAAGKAPLMMKKEIPGFVATRLQEALWREALHMVNNNEATPEQIDIALMNGPAPRMAIQGQCLAFHVACGEGGMATNLDQFGPALELPWTRLKAPELTKKLRDKMVDGCEKIVKDQKFQNLASERDKKIVEIIKIQRK